MFFGRDTALRERLPYTREGEPRPAMPEAVEAEGEVEGEEEAEAGSPVPEGALALGTAVKARYQGGDKYCAGMIHAANPDGTHDVLYDDHVLEQGVPRDMIEVVEMEANVAADLAAGDGQTVANSVNEFFETFVASLTSGAAFARLDAQQQVSITNPHTLSQALASLTLNPLPSFRPLPPRRCAPCARTLRPSSRPCASDADGEPPSPELTSMR